jgi:hypothetical protein
MSCVPGKSSHLFVVGVKRMTLSDTTCLVSVGPSNAAMPPTTYTCPRTTAAQNRNLRARAAHKLQKDAGAEQRLLAHIGCSSSDRGRLTLLLHSHPQCQHKGMLHSTHSAASSPWLWHVSQLL